jgi:hypothetical protein
VNDHGISAGMITGDAVARPMIEALEANPGRWKVDSFFVLSSSAALFSQTVKDRFLEAFPNLMIIDSIGSTEGGFNGLKYAEKGAKFTDIYAQGMGKFEAVADELANSTSGRYAAAQEIFNEQMDDFGAKFLPVVSEVLTFIVEKALPAFEGLLDTVGPILTDIVDNYVRPLVDSVGSLFDLFDKSDFNPFILALDAVKLVLDGIKLVIDLIVAGLKIIGVGKGSAVTTARDKAAADAGYGGGSYVNPMNRGGGNAGSTSVITNIVLDKKVVGQSAASYMGMLDPNPRRTYP